MDANIYIQIAVLLAVGGLLIVGGIAVLNILSGIRESATPAVQVILDALVPWAMKAIVAGEKAAAEALDEFDRKLDGIDKAQVANSLYDLLPEFINVAGRAIPTSLIKHLVTREMFAALIMRLYDETDAFVERNSDYLKKQIPPEYVPAPPTAKELSFGAASNASFQYDETQAAA